MSKDDGKVERNDDGEDIQWFENYEKRGKSGEHSDSLKKEDILNYIKDIERNCRLEMNSGDEDYVDTKRSSNCSARCPRARFKSSKVLRSKATSRRNKSANSLERKVKPNRLNARNARGYSRSSQTPRDNVDLAVNPADFRENPNAYSNKQDSYNHHDSSPRFYGWYSRKDHKTWPVTTEMTSFEIVADGTSDRRISSSNISEKRSLLLRGFELPYKEINELDTIHSNIAPDEKARVKNLPRKDHRKLTCASRCADQGDAGGFANQQPLEFYVDRKARNENCKGPCAGYRYFVRESAQPVSSSRNYHWNRPTTARLAEMSSQRRVLRRENEEEASTEPFGSIRGWIDEAYRESERRREPCCRGPGSFGESGRLRKVAHSRGDKLPLDLEDAELDEEVMDHSPLEKEYDSWLREREATSKILYRQSWNDEEPLDFDMPIGEYLWMDEENSMLDEIIFNDGVYNYDDEVQEEDSVFLDDCMSEYMSEIARKYEELTNLETNRARALRARHPRFSADEEFSSKTRTPRRRDRKLRCECREPFLQSPTCLAVGFCSCSDDNDNSRRNDDDDDDDDDDDSPRQASTERLCCDYCYCPSHDGNNSNQSFHEKANRSILREPMRSTTRSDAQRRRARHEINEQDESGKSEEAVNGRERPGMNPTTMRLGRPRYDRSTNLERILVYPPRGEVGPPLTLYKGSSNIDCRVKGDADTGFRYSVTYVQKFVSPTWMPGAPPEVETEGCEEYECSVDHG